MPKRALRTWQIWNEPHLRFQWDSDRPWQRNYGRQLRVAYKAIKRADPGATVVLAAHVQQSWKFLGELYAHGRVRGFFDVAALHPYTRRAGGVITLARRVPHGHAPQRRREEAAVDHRARAARVEGQGEEQEPLQTTDEGMADFLTTAMEKLMAGQTRPTCACPASTGTRGRPCTAAATSSGTPGCGKVRSARPDAERQARYAAFVESARRHQAA